ncbi:MAG: glycosyltransferase family 2 protein [Gammaproteobacteria bacterium]
MSNGKTLLTVVVLTRDEALHLSRLVASFEGLPCRFVIVDSGSTDGTGDVARELGADVYVHPFETHARQFNWALDNILIETPWTMRMDADEYLLPELTDELTRVLQDAPDNVGGWVVRRRMVFWGRWIRHGGYYPTWLLRVWRTGSGRIEARFMDEHVVLAAGEVRRLKHDIVDENHKGLGFWTDKHNRYANREVLDLLGMNTDDAEVRRPVGQAGLRRSLKLSLYIRAPLFLRALLFWIYRYFFRLGFIDGRAGLVFIFLQTFWYRFLVDAKLYEHKLCKETALFQKRNCSEMAPSSKKSGKTE